MGTVHVAGSSILPHDVAATHHPDVRHLNEEVFKMEKTTLRSRSYPVFAVKVPDIYNWVVKPPANVFYLRADDIFNLLHLMRLDSNFVRIWALYMAQLVYNDNEKNVVVRDPY